MNFLFKIIFLVIIWAIMIVCFKPNNTLEFMSVYSSSILMTALYFGWGDSE